MTEGFKMIVINFGKWDNAAGRWFVRKRIYINGYKWTPFCKISRRYKHKAILLLQIINRLKTFKMRFRDIQSWTLYHNNNQKKLYQDNAFKPGSIYLR